MGVLPRVTRLLPSLCTAASLCLCAPGCTTTSDRILDFQSRYDHRALASAEAAAAKHLRQDNSRHAIYWNLELGKTRFERGDHAGRSRAWAAAEEGMDFWATRPPGAVAGNRRHHELERPAHPLPRPRHRAAADAHVPEPRRALRRRRGAGAGVPPPRLADAARSRAGVQEGPRAESCRVRPPHRVRRARRRRRALRSLRHLAAGTPASAARTRRCLNPFTTHQAALMAVAEGRASEAQGLLARAAAMVPGNRFVQADRAQRGWLDAGEDPRLRLRRAGAGPASPGGEPHRAAGLHRRVEPPAARPRARGRRAARAVVGSLRPRNGACRPGRRHRGRLRAGVPRRTSAVDGPRRQGGRHRRCDEPGGAAPKRRWPYSSAAPSGNSPPPSPTSAAGPPWATPSTSCTSPSPPTVASPSACSAAAARA